MSMKSELSKIAKDTNRYLENFISRQNKTFLLRPMKYGLFSGGKKIRSKILVDTGKIFEVNYKILIALSAAVECIHSYSLIHDDLPCMDNDDIRRGKLSTHKKYGESTAILAGNSLLTARLGVGRAGTQTAALASGGQTSSNVTNGEEYDGTCWTAGGNLQAGKHHGADDGTQTAAWTAGGDAGGDSYNTSTEEYNGTSWATVNNVLTGRNSTDGCGLQTAGLMVAGNPSGASRMVGCEEYDGTSWSAGGNIATARHTSRSAGTQTLAMVTCGDDGSADYSLPECESYNGTSWSSASSMSGPRYGHAAGGTGTTLFAALGQTSSTKLATTEEHTETVTARTVTDS